MRAPIAFCPQITKPRNKTVAWHDHDEKKRVFATQRRQDNQALHAACILLSNLLPEIQSMTFHALRPLAALLLLSLAIASVPAAAQIACEYGSDTLVAQPQEAIGFVSLAFRSNSRPLLALTAGANNSQSLHLTECSALECGTGTVRLMDQSTNYAMPPGISVRSNGRPAIAASWVGGLNFYDCGDTACSFRVVRPLVQGGLGARGGVMALLPGDRAVVGDEGSSTQGNAFDLRGHTCVDAGCTSAEVQTLKDYPDDAGHSLFDLQLESSAVGDLYVSWIRVPGPVSQTEWQFMHCPGGDCSEAVPSLVSGATATSFPERISMAIREDGRPLLLDGQSGRRVLIDCSDPGCAGSVAHALPVPTTGIAGGLALDTEGRANFFRFEGGQLEFHTCLDATCSDTNSVQISLPSSLISTWDFGRAPDGRLGLVYVAAGSRQARFATCGDGRLFSNGFETQ